MAENGPGIDKDRTRYAELKKLGLKLDMSRGKPETGQLDLSVPMLHVLDDNNFISENGMDVRNYGEYKGIPDVCCNIKLPRIAKQKSPVLQG